MISLQYISHCGKSWLVGICGKSIVNEPSACSGELGGVPYMGFGNDQSQAALPVAQQARCVECGALVDVETATEAVKP
jgi:hypothetical protein